MDHLGTQGDLAERIRRERAARGWSAARLIEEMETHGVSTPRSAITKIEKGQREVSAHELWALGQVFGVTPEELLKPIELVEYERADELVERRGEAWTSLVRAVNDLVEVHAELEVEFSQNLDIYEMVNDHWSRELDRRKGGRHPADRLGAVAHGAIATAMWQLTNVIISYAREIVDKSKGNQDGKH